MSSAEAAPEIRGQEGQHDAVGLVAVAPLQVRGALGKGPPAGQPCREPGGKRKTPVAQAESPREILKRATVLRDGEAPVRAAASPR